MKASKAISLKNSLWVYLSVFSILILFFLLFFQIVFLNQYYEWYKTKEIKLAATKIKEQYQNQDDDDLATTFNNLLFERGICIDILKNDTLITYNNNMNKSCSPTSDVEVYQQALIKNGNKDTIFKSKSIKFNHKNLVYAFVASDDTYFFLTTSIEPIDSTVTILKNQFMVVSVVILILSFILSLFISKKLSKPIVALNNSAKEIAKGNYKEEFNGNSNISEIKELATTLNYAKEELSKTDDLRRDLLANVSHDLKTPLTMIKAYAEMVKDITYKDKKKREENLNIIVEEVDRLNLLVSDILDLSTMQANIYEKKQEQFNLVDIIRTIIHRYEIFALTEKYEFIFEACQEEILIIADKQKIEQVIYNLISNAINYTGDDKKITIKISDLEVQKPKKKSWKIEIIDTGKGIKKEDLPLIWDKYYKSDKKHKRNMIGTGLGLSIVKHIFELHHFEYGVITKANHGTTFYFEIIKNHQK